MAEVKDKLVDLEDLKVLSDDTTTKLGGKLAVPLNEGTAGQVLTAKGDGTSEWADAQGGGLDISGELNNLIKDGKKINKLSVSEVDDLQNPIGIAGIAAGTSKNVSSAMIQVARDFGEAIFGIAKDNKTGRKSGQFVVNTGVKDLSIYIGDTPFGDAPRGVVCEIDHKDISTNNFERFYLGSSQKKDIAGSCKGDETTISMEVGTGTLSVKDEGITMSHLAQDVKDAIADNAPTIDEADVRRIVNEQLAKMKFTINDQGHLIIETPEA